MTRKALVPITLNKQIRDFLIENVTIEEDDAFLQGRGFAACALTTNGYHIIVGKRYVDGSEEEKRYMLLHEISHIVRGDCLLMLKRKMNRGQAKMWNISADAGINYGLGEEPTKRLSGVWYPDFVTTFENSLPRDYLPSTTQIYDALEKSGAGAEGASSDYLIYEEGVGESDLRKAHTRTLLNARELLKEIPEISQHMGKLDWGNGDARGRRMLNAAPYPLPLASIILKHINGKSFGTRVHQRAFTREGRVDGLRGACLLPRINILAAIDVSGSCTHLAGRFVGASKWLAKRHSVELCAFDTQIYKYGPDVPVGGGTAFSPVYEYATQKRHDAIIMLSDGCAGDVVPMPLVPIIWVVPKNFQEMPVRASDKLIVMEDV